MALPNSFIDLQTKRIADLQGDILNIVNHKRDNKPSDQEKQQLQELITKCVGVLKNNDQGQHIIPAKGLYPHQWLWDSCFIAIGLAHCDTERAKTEILSLLRGQWANGMVPNIVLASTKRSVNGGDFWRSWLSPNAPDDVLTSGITQPPLLAEAVVRIGQKLPLAERRSWYKKVYPSILAHHQWLYSERDPHKEGLTIQIHAWETGMDNSPAWINEMRQYQHPLWIQVVEKTGIDKLLTLIRPDRRFVPAAQRLSTIDALLLYNSLRRLRRQNYDIDRILTHPLFVIEDLGFNSIFIRANQLLISIAKTIGQKIPADLQERMKKTDDALESLWDEYTGQYYSRNFTTYKLLRRPTVATLLPLYAGCISQDRAEQLVKLLNNKHLFGAAYPLPSVPLNDEWFKPQAYWQGPTWININWLVADGLERYGYNNEAEKIRSTCLELVAAGGAYEYFSPLDGTPAGAQDFSWTAALTIDLAARLINN